MVGRRQNNARLSPSLSINHYDFCLVGQFKYLGTIPIENIETTKEIEARIGLETNAFSA